ncbi:hypothetical protein Back2_17940 [Nocardioides baekrokdamisoli]|uniref:NlpC/P60 domain-containing protein n=1 Tax=Nocardioides baekrokdamisoli TaxID=1804624 RepID=A0A3G9IF01_9ACTN|nr:NlpC/P60 family protein [Nocardioides baekrokdamisoli]BBH17507.1 hypothetical protein Back2_17940 [Nocardioides baekrokdamisoli]
MTIDTTALVAGLQLVGCPNADAILEAVTQPPKLDLSIESASTLKLYLDDKDRALITSTAAIDRRCWAVLGGLHYELVGVKKVGSGISVTFEDAIPAALRRRTSPLAVPPGTVSRHGWFTRLAHEARVPHAVDNITELGKVDTVLERSSSGVITNSWDVLGDSAQAAITPWRRFSDGTQLVAGSDEWLTTLYKTPIAVNENSDGVQHIDFDLDAATPASKATIHVDTETVTYAAGQPIILEDCGPADGLWIVSSFKAAVTTNRGHATLTRGPHVLDEPTLRPGTIPNSRDSDSGDTDYLPGQTATDLGGVVDGAARARLVAFALRQVGKPYQWGATGPGGFDCSGLIAAAAAAAGKPVERPAAAQWIACEAAGATIPVAQALQIRGALLFRIVAGGPNHVAISLGNDLTVDARGPGYGVDVFTNAALQGWTGAALWV